MRPPLADAAVGDARGARLDALPDSLFPRPDAGADAFVDAVGDAPAESRDASEATAPDAGALQILTISAGTGHSCGTLSNGTGVCWGSNGAGELGDGTRVDSSVPVFVSALAGAVGVSASYLESCAVTLAGASCWGANTVGDLGDGTLTPSLVPSPVTGLAGVASIAVGGDLQATGANLVCALGSDQQVSCWGEDPFGGIGPAITTVSAVPSLVPADVASSTAVTAVAANEDDVCVLGANQAVACWGDGAEGQLGNGATMPSAVPVFVGAAAPLVASSITVGLDYACAVEVGGTVACWGTNAQGQLGDGTTNASSVPVSVVGITDAVAVSAGTSQTCALHAAGTVSCWGENNYGQLGAGVSGFTSATPVAVKGLTNATAITSGDAYNCALLSVGGPVCWGRNDSGQLGDGTTTPSDLPVAVIVTW